MDREDSILNISETDIMLCRLCKKEIERKAIVCHHCGRYQSRIYNGLQIAATFTAVIMVLIAIAQVGLNYMQMQEAKRKRIEAEAVLKQAEGVLDNTMKYSTETIKYIDNTRYYVNEQLEVQGERVQKAEEAFKDVFNDISGNIGILKKEVSKELDILKERNEVMELAVVAIAFSDRISYNKLEDIALTNKKLGILAGSEAARVKSYYLSTTRVHQDIEISGDDGNKYKNENIPTNILLKTLSESPDWRLRGRCVNLLRNRKEEKVIDVLIKSIINDPSLDVLALSIHSFSQLTGYNIIDVFDNMPHRSRIVVWWDDNKERVLKEFKK